MLDKYYNRGKIEQVDKIILFILLFMMCIIPIITHGYTSTNYSPIFTLTLYSSGERVEIFNFYKTTILYLGTVVVFGLFMYKILILKEELIQRKISIILFILAIGVILSVIFSDYKDIALFGNPDRFEGALAWFCYIVIFFVLYNIKINIRDFKLFYLGLFPFLIVNLFLGLAQFFGVNVLESKILTFIIGGGNLSGTFWTTLYHFNLMSGIASVIFSASLVYMLFEKDIKKKIIPLIGSIISFIIVLVSNSISGFLASILLFPIILVLAWRFVDKKELCIWTIIMVVINFIIYTILDKYNPNVYQETFSIFGKLNQVSVLILPMLIISFILLIVIMKFVNKKKFFNFVMIFSVLIVSIGLLFFSDRLNKENSILENNPSSNIVKIEDSKVFQAVNGMSTDRLNIWTKVMHFINENPIFGNGFDTFPYKFISTDKNGALSTYGEVIDKPHSWYMSVAYGSGVIGLLGLIGVILYLIKQSFYRCVDKNNDKFLYIFFIGFLAYVIQGFFNDSLAGTSIICWVFAGLTVNRIFERKSE
ncbi:O-antigen ligase family protein [Clostridioides sp. ES-S-0123-01]|uniref:O-antigen ligase family protein n=1 Tax=Clostridioides sp. ES-S-0123-01 TaxID=2770783 RepID=UPI001D10D260|nr:O-antigen ligase family protein [Clostridioides sp. ES-S-0123-01]